MTKDKQKNKTKDNPISLVTGEHIDSKETAIENLGYIDEQIEILKQNKQQIKKSQGLEKPRMVRQKNRFFYKMYKIDWEIISHLSMPTFKVLKFLEMNMEYISNTVMINNLHPTYEEMIKVSGVGDRQFRKAIKELKESKIIYTERKGRYNIITMSPLYMEDSLTSEEVYKRCGIERQ